MRYFLGIMSSLVLLNANLWAMDEPTAGEVTPKICPMAKWSKKLKEVKPLRSHASYSTPDKPVADLPVRMVIGHTVTDKGDEILTLQAIETSHMAPKPDGYGFDAIGYTACLGRSGTCYRCRDMDAVPALLQGHNIGSIGLGLIGAFHEDKEEQKIPASLVRCWGTHIGMLAKEVGIKHLVRGKDGNIFGMSELKPDQYPYSPGKNFMVVFDDVVKAANAYLKNVPK